MRSELLTTGHVARVLGVSRQHVVDLCDRGTLPCVRTRVHRRVPRVEVEALMKRHSGLTREEMRSLWLNRAVAAHVAREPHVVVAHARKNLDRYVDVHEGTSVTRWLKRWRQIIDRGPEVVMETLTSTTAEAAELRQNSPFAGVLSARERRAVLDSFASYWPPSAG